MPRFLALIAILMLLLGCGALPKPVDDSRTERETGEARRVPKDPYDAEVFAKLKKAGHDFSKKTTVGYYLYFPDEASARATIHVLSANGYRGDLKQADGKWLAYLQKDMVLTADEVDIERSKMRDLTVNSGGEYDGWEAQVVR